MSRKASDAGQICSSCSLSLDGDFISCRHCSKAFHAKKDCGLAAAACKAVLSSDNVTFLCNNCKSYNICELFDRLSAMETEILNLKEQLSLCVTSEIGQIVSEVLKEHCDRHERRNNIIAFGVEEPPESDDEEEKDDENISNLCETLGFPRHKIASFSRIGRRGKRPRPMRLRFDSYENKISCLRNSRKLRSSGVFLKHDLTQAQVAFEKLLSAELKQRRADGEDVVIRRGEVVPRSQFA